MQNVNQLFFVHFSLFVLRQLPRGLDHTGINVASTTQRETYKLEAMAQDKGYPPLSRTVEVQIDVVDRANNPPVWDHVVYGPIYVKENMPVGGKVVSIKARSVILTHSLSLPQSAKWSSSIVFYVSFVELWSVPSAVFEAEDTSSWSFVLCWSLNSIYFLIYFLLCNSAVSSCECVCVYFSVVNL